MLTKHVVRNNATLGSVASGYRKNPSSGLPCSRPSEMVCHPGFSRTFRVVPQPAPAARKPPDFRHCRSFGYRWTHAISGGFRTACLSNMRKSRVMPWSPAGSGTVEERRSSPRRSNGARLRLGEVGIGSQAAVPPADTHSRCTLYCGRTATVPTASRGCQFQTCPYSPDCRFDRASCSKVWIEGQVILVAQGGFYDE